MTPDTGASGGSAAEAKALTRFLMFEPFTDEECALVGIPPGTGWKIVGTRDADGRDSAETGFYKDVDVPVRCAPVSENAWKPRTTKPRVVQPRTRVPLELDLSGLPSSAAPSANESDGPAGDPLGASGDAEEGPDGSGMVNDPHTASAFSDVEVIDDVGPEDAR